MTLQENCIGANCPQLKYLVDKEKETITIVNESNKLLKLKFKAKPFKNHGKMQITQYLNPNDSLLIPSLNYRRLKVKKYKFKE